MPACSFIYGRGEKIPKRKKSQYFGGQIFKILLISHPFMKGAHKNVFLAYKTLSLRNNFTLIADTILSVELNK